MFNYNFHVVCCVFGAWFWFSVGIWILMPHVLSFVVSVGWGFFVTVSCKLVFCFCLSTGPLTLFHWLCALVICSLCGLVLCVLLNIWFIIIITFLNRCNRFESKQKLVKAKCLQINREGNILDGLSVKLCFESGVLPNWVMVGYVSYPVKAYVCAPL